MSEGADGDTLTELRSFLKHDLNIENVRKHYSEALKNLLANDPLKAPQFKTWFYYYMNNTIDDDFAKVLRDTYFVEVKEIARNYYDWNEPDTSVDLMIDSSLEANDEKVNTEDEKIDQNIDDNGVPGRTVEASNDNNIKQSTKIPDANNSKDIIGFDELKSEKFDNERSENSNEKSIEVSDEPFDKSSDPIPEKECSKFDQVVDDQQYVEVPVIKKEIEDNETVKSNEKIDKFIDVVESKSVDAPVKVQLPLKKLEDSYEIMHAVESHAIRKRVNITNFIVIKIIRIKFYFNLFSVLSRGSRIIQRS